MRERLRRESRGRDERRWREKRGAEIGIGYLKMKNIRAPFLWQI